MGRPAKPNLPLDFQQLLRQIGANIIALRQEIEISQAELSRRSKVSITTVNEIEKKQSRDIQLSTLSAIAKTLKVPVSRLLEQSDVEISKRDQAQLLKASEAIVRITKKLQP